MRKSQNGELPGGIFLKSACCLKLLLIKQVRESKSGLHFFHSMPIGQLRFVLETLFDDYK